MTSFNLSQFCLIVAIFPENVGVEERSGTSSRTGKPYTIRTQRGWFKRPSKRFPEEFVFPAPEGAAYSEGPYVVDPNSFSQGDFEAMELDRYAFRLVAIPPEFYEQLAIPQLYASFGLKAPHAEPVKPGK